LSQVQDLLPTLADLAGIETIPERLDGESLGPVLRGERDGLDDRMLVINYSRMPTFKVTYTKDNPAIPQRDGAAVLWKQWRLLENRALYDIRSDLHQDHDVAADHPQIVAKMRAHLNTWWDGVKDDVMQPQRVVIGSDYENPMMLTACEWLDVFIDQQVQVRRAELKNGVWHLRVDQAGTYAFELRRWPRESGLKLADGLKPTPVTDGQYVAGKPLPVAAARLKIGEFDETRQPDEGDQSVTFTVSLKPGDTEMQTWFLDAQGNSVLGAYYVYVARR
jgi:arylsulfatase